jgi:putative photosynthetic complex assembly protein 2
MAILFDHVVPALCALAVWWFSTGLVIYIVGLPRSTFRWSGGMAGLLAVVSLAGLANSSGDATVAGAYGGFIWAIALWGALEIWFLLGQVTGSRCEPCPVGARGWRRAWLAILAILYHEISLLVAAIAVVAFTWGGENQIGAWTFALLWVMRLSAKLNLFLGVPILHESFLPDQLRYLASFFRKGPINLLFPVSVTAATAACTWLVMQALAPSPSPIHATACILLATLMALAIVEHWFMVVPLPVEALWNWSMRSRVRRTEPVAAQAAERAPRRSDLARQNLEDRFRQSFAKQTTKIEVTPARRLP